MTHGMEKEWIKWGDSPPFSWVKDVGRYQQHKPQRACTGLRASTAHDTDSLWQNLWGFVGKPRGENKGFCHDFPITFFKKIGRLSKFKCIIII